MNISTVGRCSSARVVDHISQLMIPTIDRTKSSFRCLGISTSIGLALAISLVVLSLFTEGTVMATRTATQLAMPLGAIWLVTFLLSVNAWLQGQRFFSISSFAIFVILTVVANRYVGLKLQQPLHKTIHIARRSCWEAASRIPP